MKNSLIVSLIADAVLYFVTLGLIKYITHSYDAKYLAKPIFIFYNLLGLFLYSPLKFAVLSFGIVVITFLLVVFV